MGECCTLEFCLNELQKDVQHLLFYWRKICKTFKIYCYIKILVFPKVLLHQILCVMRIWCYVVDLYIWHIEIKETFLFMALFSITSPYKFSTRLKSSAVFNFNHTLTLALKDLLICNPLKENYTDKYVWVIKVWKQGTIKNEKNF